MRFVRNRWVGAIPLLAVVPVYCVLAAGAFEKDKKNDGSAVAAPGLRPHLVAVRGETRFWHDGPVYSILPLPDGKRVLTSSLVNVMRLWNLESGRELRAYDNGQGAIGASLLDGGKKFLVACKDGMVRAWDVETGKLLQTYKGGEKWLRNCASPANGSMIVAAGDDGIVYVWAEGKPEPRYKLAGHTDEIMNLALAPDGRTAATGGANGELKLWDIEQGKLLRELKEHSDKIGVLAFDAKGERLVSGSDDESICCWKVANGTKLWSEWVHDHPEGAAWSLDGREITFVNYCSKISVRESTSGRELRDCRLPDVPNTVAYIQDGKQLLVSVGYSILTYDAATLKKLEPGPGGEGHLSFIDSILPLPSGKVVTVEKGRQLCWDGDAPPVVVAETRRLVSEWLSVPPEGEYGACLTTGPTLFLYDLTSEKMEAIEKKWNCNGLVVRATPVGLRSLVAVGVKRGEKEVGQYQIWDGKLERKISALEGDINIAGSEFISSDGAYVAAILEKDQLRIWDAATGKVGLTDRFPGEEKEDLDYFWFCDLNKSGVLLLGVGDRLRAWRRIPPGAKPTAEGVKREEQRLASEDADERLAAARALVAMGPGVLSFLTPPDQAKDLEVRAQLSQVREKAAVSNLPLEFVENGSGKGASQWLTLPGRLFGMYGHPTGRYFAVLVEKDEVNTLWWGEVADDGMRLLEKIEIPGIQPSHAIAFSTDGKFLYVGMYGTRYFVFELK